MGKFKNMIIEMEEMRLQEPYPWDMGAPLCKRCDSSRYNVIEKGAKTMIVHRDGTDACKRRGVYCQR